MPSPSLSLTLMLSLASLLSFTTATCDHGTFLNRRQLIHKRAEGTNETEKTVKVGQFGYIGNTGPANWAQLSVNNSACSSSSQQSPIDITAQSTTIVPAGTLNLTIPNVEAAEFENLGTTIEVVLEGVGGKMTSPEGKEFELKQFHFHSPSEHTINGEYFPLEIHMVHEAEDGALAVASILFTLTTNNTCEPLIRELLPSLAAIKEPGSVTETGPLDFTSVLKNFAAQELHTYNGSLTTPPCAEGLQFFVTSKPMSIDVLGFNALKGVVGFNSRFTQNTIGSPNVLLLGTAANAANNKIEGSTEGSTDTTASTTTSAAEAQLTATSEGNKVGERGLVGGMARVRRWASKSL